MTWLSPAKERGAGWEGVVGVAGVEGLGAGATVKQAIGWLSVWIWGTPVTRPDGVTATVPDTPACGDCTNIATWGHLTDFLQIEFNL